ncbi:transposase [Limosilactobacillus reuteri]|uniref:transposase n=1 Tax=Limosilactobacillus reuteri TaxID=1598 RepID=UPI00232EB08D|nr:transposase [Limosilactobacillus reuteri]
MTKYSTKFKTQAVKAYLDGEGGFAYLANKFGLPSTYDLRKWVDLVKEQGFQALQVSHGKRYYSLDFKLEVINYSGSYQLLS